MQTCNLKHIRRGDAIRSALANPNAMNLTKLEPDAFAKLKIQDRLLRGSTDTIHLHLLEESACVILTV